MQRSTPSFGIDAPRVVAGLFTGAGATGMAALALAATGRSAWIYPAISFGWCALQATTMVASSRFGKLRLFNSALDELGLRSDERLLGVGCGRGALLLAAARRLPRGTAVGVDIWSARDQSGNDPRATRANAEAAGVSDRVELIEGDARSLPFAADSFDVVVSSLCLHNIDSREGRAIAAAEIDRVLRPGGMLLALDIARTRDLVTALRERGWSELHRSRPRGLTIPPSRTVNGRKPQTL